MIVQERKVAAGYALAVLLLIGAGVLQFVIIQRLIDSNRWVTHTDQVIAEIEATGRALLDTMAGGRGYAIVGDPEDLQRYQSARATVEAHFDRLRRLTADNPQEQRRLTDAQRLLQQPLQALDQMVEARQRHNKLLPGDLVFNGTRLTGAIDVLIGPMKEEERELLRRRTQVEESAVRKVKPVIWLGVFLALTVVGFAADASRRHALARDQAEEQLRAQAVVLQGQASLLDIAHDSIIIRDLGGLISFWNQGAEATYGWSKDQAVGQVSHTLLQARFPEPLEEIKATMLREGLWEGELDHARSNGSRIVVLSRWVLQRDEQGRPLKVLESNNDITSRKRTEQAIQDLNRNLELRNAELAEANQELEAFTYSVAHDLRAPLRHAQGFSKSLLEDFGGQLPPGAREYLHDIVKSTQQMGQLIDDLLGLARLGRQELHLEVTGLGAIVQEVLQGLQVEVEGRDISWQVGELPFVECDPGLIKQALYNLIANAVKYTRPRRPAVIEIGQIAQDGQRVVFVKDNGVGFNMKYAGKLFGVFQRLHRREDFEGTGVGLATVQRIVRKHGGRVWAEAEVDKGATFYFTLGAASSEQ